MKDKIVWKELNGDKMKTAFSKSRDDEHAWCSAHCGNTMFWTPSYARWLLNWFQEGVKLQSHGIDLT